VYNRILVGKPVGKIPLGRPRRKWKDNIKMDIQEVECGVRDWVDLVHKRDKWREIVNVVMNFFFIVPTHVLHHTLKL
jgi:hypothetical protein